MSNIRLSTADIQHYRDEGYLVLRQAISTRECERLENALLARLDTYGHTVSVPRDKVFPEPAKYTLAANDWAEPDLAFIAEHPIILDAVSELLGDAPLLTAYVAYVRPPNDAGTKAHCDHKRWRPVGSSLNWCFTIVPLVDFDAEVGPLLVRPRSHQLIQPIPGEDGRTMSVRAPDKSRLGKFVDTRLKRGDLLLLHGNTWHEAPPNRSNRLRIGLFNKYAARNAPPAAGFFKWSNAVFDSLGPRGQQTLAVHSDRALHAARLVLDRKHEGKTQVLLRNEGNRGWTLPGGWVGEAGNQALDAGLDGAWDTGNLIGALNDLCLEQTNLDMSWMSYVADYEEENHLCRVYGGTLTKSPQRELHPGVEWTSVSRLEKIRSGCPFLQKAIELWVGDNAGIVRGKGKSEHQCLPVIGPRQFVD